METRPVPTRTITHTSSTTRTVNHDWSKDIGAIVSSIAWPAAILISIWLLVANLEKIAGAVRGAPFLRRFAFGGFEIELDREQLNELKRDTEQTFADLMNKVNGELEAFADALHASELTESAAHAIIKHKFGGRAVARRSNLRFTIHIPDVVFKDFLYQLTGYVTPPGSDAASGGGAGRRFSKRYGLIGLSWRTLTSRGVGEAFQGDTAQVQQLIEHWSMNEAEAAHAKKKPSCLAVIARDTRTPEHQMMLGREVGLMARAYQAFLVGDISGRVSPKLVQVDDVLDGFAFTKA
jgi:hypothetical protein